MRRTLATIALLALLASAASAVPSGRGPLSFRVSFGKDLRNRPATGRVYVLVSRSKTPEPRFQVDIVDGTPFWGKDVTEVVPGRTMVLGMGRAVYGYPLPSLSQLPPGDYYVQAFLNVYTTFHRSDGSVVQLHMPCGDGGYFLDSPGNLYGAVERMHLDPAGGPVTLRLTHEIQPSDPVPPGGTCRQGNPADSAHVKHLKIKSEMLSKFWGRPMYLGANVLLPEGYDDSANASVRYPVIYEQTHFPYGNPFGFMEDLSNPFSRFWVSVDAPRVIVVDIRHETPYFDDSYSVNSANLGPYGDAITKELIPAIDASFRTTAQPWARTLTGASTGGWEALAQQVFYPDLYGGTWALCPDPVDFRFHQLVNVYSDQNSYWNLHEWVRVPRPSARETSGDLLWTMAQENHWELALGTHGRSQLGQWDIWQAVFGPQGSDGYPAPIWNKRTGAIDHSVARAWRSMDIRAYLQANWPTVGPKLQGRIHVYVGDADTFFLNDAVELLQAFLDDVKNPPANADIRYGYDQPHCWSPYSDQELVTVMAQAMAQAAPAGAATHAWLPDAARTPVPAGNHVVTVPQRERAESWVATFPAA